jgi:hypothetical protein
MGGRDGGRRGVEKRRGELEGEELRIGVHFRASGDQSLICLRVCRATAQEEGMKDKAAAKEQFDK